MAAAPQSYTVLIDGYNVIKRHGPWRQLSLEHARQQLLGLLGCTPWPLPISSVLVVFDGAGEGTSAPKSTSRIRVRFAAPSADSYILDQIRSSASPRHLAVISDDTEILRAAKSHGVVRWTATWLFERHQRPVRPPPHDIEPKTTLPASVARRITEELERRWLGKG